MSIYMPMQNPWWRNPLSIEDDEKVQLALHSRRPFIPPFDLAGNAILIGPRQVGMDIIPGT
jgi:predicted AAA+ superfamily ATPase